MALLLSYLLETPFSATFLVLNIPFYLLAFLRLGKSFTFSTIVSTGVLALMTEVDKVLPSFIIPEWAGALLGGAIVGLGLSYLFMNGASLGGGNILALYFLNRFGWDPGKTTFLVDSTVVMLGIFSVGLTKGLYSVLSIVILSAIVSYYKGRINLKNQTIEQANTA